MSAMDDLSRKYLDEVSSLIPLPSVFAFLFGICFFGVSDGDGSRWLSFLGVKYEKVWFFRDLIFSQEMWRIFVVFFLSLFGFVLAKEVSIRSLSRGMRKNSESIISVFERAKAIADGGKARSGFELEAARSWRERRMRGAWIKLKAASFVFSVGLISISSLNFIDLVIGFLIIIFATYISFVFSVRYMCAYLPERIFLDSSMGLLEPKVVEELRASAIAE